MIRHADVLELECYQRKRKLIPEFWIQQMSRGDAILLRLGRPDIGNYMRSFIY